jgi:hypothetical protein
MVPNSGIQTVCLSTGGRANLHQRVNGLGWSYSPTDGFLDERKDMQIGLDRIEAAAKS